MTVVAGEDPNALMPEELQNINQEVLSDPEVIALLNNIACEERLPDSKALGFFRGNEPE